MIRDILIYNLSRFVFKIGESLLFFVLFLMKLKKKKTFFFLEETEINIFNQNKFSIVTKLLVMCQALSFTNDSCSACHWKVQAKWLHSETFFWIAWTTDIHRSSTYRQAFLCCLSQSVYIYKRFMLTSLKMS